LPRPKAGTQKIGSLLAGYPIAERA